MDGTTHLDYLGVDIPKDGYDEGYLNPAPSWNELYRMAFEATNDELKAANPPLETSAFINVAKPPYNAPENGNGDATAAIQQAIDDLPANGGTLFFPYMCRTTSTLDATNRRNIRWTTPFGKNLQEAIHRNHETGGIVPRTFGAPAIDATGSYDFIFENGFSLYAPLGVDRPEAPNIGVLMTRSQANNVPAGHDFVGCRMYGDFPVACVYSMGKELSIVDRAFFTQTGNGEIFIHDAHNAEGITSEFANIRLIDSATEWLYIANTFDKYGTDGTAFRYSGITAGHTFLGNHWHVEGGQNDPVLLFDTAEQNLTGPYWFWNPRLEGDTETGAFIKKEGANDLLGVKVDGGQFTSTTYTLDLRGSGGKARYIYYDDAVTSFTADKSGIITGNLEESRISYRGGADIEVDNLADSTIEIYNKNGTLTVNGTITGSDVRTHISDNQFRHDLSQGRIRYRPRSTPPLSPAVGDVLMQDGTGWNPTGSGQQELVTYDGTNWVPA